MTEPATALIPTHPPLVRAAARLTSLYSKRPIDLSVEGLKRRATRATGLTDFGDEPLFYEWLDLVSQTLTENPNLTPFSHVTASVFYHARLSNKLRLNDYVKRHPEVVERPLKEPIFIVGWYRTGTTALHNLLECVPGIDRLPPGS